MRTSFSASPLNKGLREETASCNQSFGCRQIPYAVARHPNSTRIYFCSSESLVTVPTLSPWPGHAVRPPPCRRARYHPDSPALIWNALIVGSNAAADRTATGPEGPLAAVPIVSAPHRVENLTLCDLERGGLGRDRQVSQVGRPIVLRVSFLHCC